MTFLRTLRLLAAALALALVVSACSNDTAPYLPGEPGSNPNNPAADFDFTYLVAGEDLTVELTGDIISWVDFYLDDALSPFVHDETAPFRATVSGSELDPGEHEIRVVVTIDLLDAESTVTRYVRFTVEDGVPTDPVEPEAPTPPPPSPTSPTVDGEATLLARYHVLKEFDAGDQVEYLGITYRPRASTYSGFQGWDMLTLPGGTYRTYTRPDWLHISLNRDATLAVLLDGSRTPNWLSSWTRGPDVSGMRSFTRSFNAGPVVLGAIGGTANRGYTVLFAEADGSPSAAPSVPSGLPTPQPNQQCPEWVHDSYTTTGPDGRLYPTWHPQIDPVYWCYIGHQHGSAGSLLAADFQPEYNYIEAHGGPVESHEGFHALVVNYTGNDGRAYRLYKETHIDTSSVRRVCTETHSERLVLYDVAAAEIVADLRFKPSFGPSRNAGNFNPYRPDACPENANIDSTWGARNIPPVGNNGYETWQLVLDNYPQLGVQGRLTVAYLNPMTRCSDGTECNSAVGTGMTNTRQWMITPDGGVSFRASRAFDDGVFYTDPWGNERRNGDEADAVRQYIKPGLNVTVNTGARFWSEDAWFRSYIDNSIKTRLQPEMELEGGIQTVD